MWSSNAGVDRLSERNWLVAKTGNVLLKGARLVDPSQDLDEVANVLITRGKITQIGKDIDTSGIEELKTLDLSGKILCPGLFDMHVHLREPGREDKETILTGTTAAVAGGFTGVACMPNTTPSLDNVGVIRWIYDMAAGSPVTVHPIAAITKDRSGKELTEFSDLYNAGVRALSDDGGPVMNSEVMRRALEYSLMHDQVLSTHSEDMDLAGEGVMREGEVSTRLGMKPWPSLAESTMVARDVLLAHFTGARLHVGHISSKESLDMVRWAKANGAKVTSEATPHHIALTDEACTTFDSNFKMNPPLGTKEDQQAVVEAIIDGTVDCIATDHAPHTYEEKTREFSAAPNGVVGLETAVGIVVKELINKKKIDWSTLVDKMAIQPRTILRLPAAALKTGAMAELTVIDPEASWKVEPEKFLSKGRNTPFGGWTLPAKPLGILNRGWLLIAPEGKIYWS